MNGLEKSEALRVLAQLVGNRLEELKRRPIPIVSQDVERKEEVYNQITSQKAHTVAPKTARKAIDALALPPEERTSAHLMLTLVRERKRQVQFPRRRQAGFRQRQGEIRR